MISYDMHAMGLLCARAWGSLILIKIWLDKKSAIWGVTIFCLTSSIASSDLTTRGSANQLAPSQRVATLQPWRGFEWKVISFLMDTDMKGEKPRGSVSYNMEYPPPTIRAHRAYIGIRGFAEMESYFVFRPGAGLARLAAMQRGQKQTGHCHLGHAATLRPRGLILSTYECCFLIFWHPMSHLPLS